MKYTIPIIVLLFIISCSTTEDQTMKDSNTTIQANEFAIVVHGGAGYRKVDDETDKKTKTKLNEALQAGHVILKAGGKSQDAVIAAIKILEDSPLFNAGKGGVLTNEGTNELDASIMEGKTLNAGAVGGVKTIKNPITAALAVMENSRHVMLSGDGADQFAKLQGLELVENTYFQTERRKKALQKAIEREQEALESTTSSKTGTVGCVALDKSGTITAGTSTGGMTNKRYGRIGDSPIIGAGTYANNQTCGVSCTGHGEFFIRYAVAYDMSAMMQYQNLDVKTAGETIINKKLKEVNGDGGLIAIDKYGRIAMPFNSEAMARGYMLPDGEANIFLYRDEPVSSY